MAIPKDLVDIEMGTIRKVLDDKELADVTAGPVGRFRLVKALQNKFGVDFRLRPEAKDAIESFDRETKDRKVLIKTRELIQNGR